VSELGQVLRKARLERKISIEDLEETTKIRKRYLEAIEEGNYKILPGSFYVRAFIKSYAEAVGLDPSEVLRMYQSVIPAPSVEQQTVVDPIRNKRGGSRTDRFNRYASGAMMVSFVILILGVIYYYAYQNYKGTSTGDTTNPTETKRLTDKMGTPAPSPNPGGATASAQNTPAPLSTVVPTLTPTPVKPQVEFLNSDKGVDFYNVNASGKLSIQVKIKGTQCWILLDAITADNKRVTQKQKTYSQGETDTWELDSSAYLRVGAAAAVEVIVNGTPIQVGDALNPKNIQFNLQKS
jgi:cytoskeletal protein RodZ